MKVNPDLAGLRTRNPADRIALRGVRLVSHLSGMSQRTTIEQTFVNLERQAIEAVYTFPLPESAAVCGFEVVTGDRVLTGQVEEIEQAVEQYDRAVGDGHGAFMVEENRPDVFTVRVGNLKPRQAVTIRLTYVCPLERADKSVRVAFPTTLAPRYVTESGTDPLPAMIDGDALNPPHVLSVPYGLTLQVDLDLGRTVNRITSPSHAIRVDGAGADRARASVTFAAGLSEMNRDVVLNIELPREHEPVVQAATGPGGATYLAVSFVPEFDIDELLDPQPVETVFVLDCSGSMQGESIRQATAALELCLRSLSVGDTFNICRFGSTFDLLGKEPIPYSDYAVVMAANYLLQGADLGGTELYPALCAVLAPKRRPGAPRQVILLTDGQVSNEPACIELARKMRGHNRIFAFGIGTACSSSLVKGLARATGGAAEFIYPGERIDEKVLRTFGRLNSPVVHDVAIDWDGCDVQTLAELPPVFDGDVMTVFGRAPRKPPRTVTLSCRAPSGPKRWGVPVPEARDDGGVIATMWARRTIQSLEEVNNLHRERYAAAGTRSTAAATLVNLSKEFNLLSSLTTFLAVEHRSVEERNEGRPTLRRVPVALAEGWGDIQLFRRGAFTGEETRLLGLAAPAGAGATIDKTIDSTLKSFDKSVDRSGGPRFSVSRRKASKPSDAEGSGLLDLCRESEASEDGAAPARAIAPPGSVTAGAGRGPLDELYAVLSAQSANGSFAPRQTTWDLLRAHGFNTAQWPKEIEHSAPAMAGGLLDRDAVVRTTVALLVLRRRFPDYEPLWRRAAGKAVNFLAQSFGCDAGTVREWVKQLEARLLAPVGA
jgi:Ca-activated chloride channel homolog